MLRSIVNSRPEEQSPEYYRSAYLSFLEDNCYDRIQSLLLLKVELSIHIGVDICPYELIDFQPKVSFLTFCYPKLLFQLFDEALLIVQSNVSSHPTFRIQNQSWSIKTNCHIRFSTLPPMKYYSKHIFSEIGASDISRMIRIEGTVISTGPVKLLEVSKRYECKRSNCMHRFTVYADPEHDNQLPQPRSCPSVRTNAPTTSANDDRERRSTRACTSSEFTEIEGSKVCVDYQEIKIQDRIENLDLGTMPRSIVVILQAELVDKFLPGDKVTVVGYMVRKWRFLYKGERGTLATVFHANNLKSCLNSSRENSVDGEYADIKYFSDYWKSHEKTKFSGRDKILRSFCPQLFGMYTVKLALLLTIISGSRLRSQLDTRKESEPADQEIGKKSIPGDSIQNESMSVREQSHMLIVGDPGCGKSQLLRFVSQLYPKTILTTGIGTTGAGLTCSVVREGAEWILEAGALVLANGGICCIDEFSSIKTHDRATIHEAMEQQTISVAKAGLLSKLQSKTSIIATCNPKGTYDVNLDISTNTSVSPSLLSRFDIILVLLDQPTKDWDKKVSTHLLCTKLSDTNTLPKPRTVEWNMNRLRNYVLYVKNNLNPKMSLEASQIIMKYFHLRRRENHPSMERVSVRLLESLLRLSQAHAKLMYQKEVLLHDAIIAINCVSCSQTQSISEINPFHSKFPENSEEAYITIETEFFRSLDMTKQSFIESLKPENELNIQDMRWSETDNSSVESPITSQKISSNITNEYETKEKPINYTETVLSSKVFPSSSILQDEEW